MFKNKKHLFFDLDHTLWDYETCSQETLTELWQLYELKSKGVKIKSFLLKFQEINDQLWDQYHKGKIGKDAIRNDRFPAIFQALELTDEKIALAMQANYLQICPTKPHLIEGAMEVLDSLSGKYSLHIITNGFDEIQGTKLASGGIQHYFDEIITSGKAGYQKPDKRIFEYALETTGATVVTSLMIGDNPFTDIEGANNAGIDQVFFNPNGQECTLKPTLEICSLKDILEFL